MKNWKCKLDIHKYETIGQQNVPNMVGGFSMTTLNREVQKCKRCGKVHFVGYDIATNAHLDEALNWQPKFI